MSSATITHVENRGERLSLVIEIIDFFLDRRTEIPFRDLIAHTNLDRRTLYRYLQSFEAHGLLERCRETAGRGGQSWKRGPRLLSMAGRR